MIKVMIVHLATKQVIKTDLVCRPNVGDVLPLIKLSDKVVNVVFAIVSKEFYGLERKQIIFK